MTNRLTSVNTVTADRPMDIPALNARLILVVLLVLEAYNLFKN